MRPLFYDDQDLRERLRGGGRSLFLGVPSALGVLWTPWRARALELLEGHGYEGMVVVPEPRDGSFF